MQEVSRGTAAGWVGGRFCGGEAAGGILLPPLQIFCRFVSSKHLISLKG